MVDRGITGQTKTSGRRRRRRGRAPRALAGLGMVLLAALATGAGQPSGETVEWPAYAGDPGGMRHAPLAQITPENVGDLAVAWTYRTGELAAYAGTNLAAKAAFEATPIMVDGALYLSTPTDRVIALDAASGAERWVYDPKLDLALNYSEVTSRGVSTWVDPTKRADQPGRRLLYVGTLDGRLIALDAATGRPSEAFGEDGIVDLKVEVGNVQAGQYQVTSPPAVIGDLVVVGTAIGDNRSVASERGTVRAYDARTGALRWSWDPVPRRPDQPGYETWRGPLAHEAGGANAWPPISADPERGLLFVPTTSPSPDYYGGERLGDNLYADSVVALRASSGTVVWHFQAVHHDIWDYDTPMQPALLTLERDGEAVPAVAIGTKMGHIFVLHRETGEPLFPVEERPVPRTDVPGEETSPTQPFPVGLPAFGLRSVTPDDAWGLTPEGREAARQRIASLRSEGPFTPVSLQGSIGAPSNAGGFNWGGLTYDPARGILVGVTNRLAAVARLIPRAEAPPSGGGRLGVEVGLQRGTPYAVERTLLVDFERRVPMTPPPWGTLAAVNLKTGQLQFEVPLGYMFDPRQYPEAEGWGAVSFGGPTTTAGGLVFVAATVDGHLRAFDTDSGRLLWQDALPTGGQATPMSYGIGGTQYVVIAAGGHGTLGVPLGDYVIAYALPERATGIGGRDGAVPRPDRADTVVGRLVLVPRQP